MPYSGITNMEDTLVEDLLFRMVRAMNYLIDHSPQNYVLISFYYLDGLYVHRQLWDRKENKPITPVMVWNSVQQKYTHFTEKL